MKIENIEMKWLGHSSFLINCGKKIYIDPFNISKPEPADVVLITHSHYDHCSVQDIDRVVRDGTLVILPAACQSKITKLDKKIEMQIIEPGDEIAINGFKVIAFPAYNLKKEFHPKNEGWVGYVLKLGKVIIYHAGDTDSIPEMKNLTGYGKEGNKFLALLPVDGKYAMGPEEAAEAAYMIKPSIAFPIHYSLAGGDKNAQDFVKLCQEKGIRAEILEKE